MDILDHLGLSKTDLPKNINNNYKQLQTLQTITNELQTSLLMGSNEHQEVEEKMTSSPLGKPSQEKEFLDSNSQGGVVESKPAAWRGVKYDLYMRGYLKSGKANLQLNIAPIRSIDGQRIHLKAVLNQIWEKGFMSKGVDDWLTNPHWIKVKQHYKDLTSIYKDVRVSKCIEPNRAGTWDLTVFVFKDHTDQWRVDLVAEGQVYSTYLNGEISELQGKTNVIATKYFGQIKTKIKCAKAEGWL
jgi:hypothetical protein